MGNEQGNPELQRDATETLLLRRPMTVFGEDSLYFSVSVFGITYEVSRVKDSR